MSNNENRDLEFLTVREVSRMTNLHITTIDKMLARGEFCKPFRMSKKPGAVRYWTRKMIVDWIEGLKAR